MRDISYYQNKLDPLDSLGRALQRAYGIRPIPARFKNTAHNNHPRSHKSGIRASCLCEGEKERVKKKALEWLAEVNR
jgi:hypothetical protein